LDLGRCGGGWDRIKYVCRQLKEIGRPIKCKNTNNEILLESLDNLPINTEEDIENLKKWVNCLEMKKIYFSYPLDLDFSMAQIFPDAYRKLNDGARGPCIPNANDADKDKNEKLALQRMLKAEGDTSCYPYQKCSPELFFWYNYLFLGRGKPVSHINALANIERKRLAYDAPQELKALIDCVKEFLEKDNGAI